ncbi:hypothetical protein EVAR_95773_1 [Eumeta japonica]|uniref:Uncharacterized protein n=1 Tax=Eumeta variegata TaxID=151549 RepID=A0A4C1ULL0_EUMVA|nr:hypothetical protein EVAR_95773_1 [Eumeta japonica]
MLHELETKSIRVVQSTVQATWAYPPFGLGRDAMGLTRSCSPIYCAYFALHNTLLEDIRYINETLGAGRRDTSGIMKFTLHSDTRAEHTCVRSLSIPLPRHTLPQPLHFKLKALDVKPSTLTHYWSWTANGQ